MQWGDAYTGDATFSLVITPSLLVPHNWVKHVSGGWGPSTRRCWVWDGEMLPTLVESW